MRVIDGEKHGLLTAVRYVGESETKSRISLWEFICDCGTLKVIRKNNVLSGHTTSCGCIRKESAKIARQRFLKHIEILSRFGRLVVIEEVGSVGGHLSFMCKCDCGNTTLVSGSNLRKGNTTSCGCAKKDFYESSKVDLTGRRFGMLVVVGLNGVTYRYGTRANGYSYKTSISRWLCRCDCGGEKIVLSGPLRSGVTVSCGCSQHKRIGLMSPDAREVAAVNHSKRRAIKNNTSGSFSQAQVRELYFKQKGRCAGCGIKLGDSYHRDHIIPMCSGGLNDISNIQLLCAACNLSKNKKHPIEWAQKNGRLL